LQARARGTLLMAISNKTGAMVVTTGNKSEMSVGYATLYGDMNGGFNPIKDIYKTEVFRLSALRNSWKAGRRARPLGRGHSRQYHHPAADRGIAREPDRPGFAAALRHAGRDPAAAVEREEPLASIIAAGFDKDVVTRIDRLLNIAEYKRGRPRRASRSRRRILAATRRYPITNRFRDLGKALPEPDEKLVTRGGRASVEAFDD